MNTFLKLTLLVTVLGLSACGDNRYFGDARMGGAGSAVMEVLATSNARPVVEMLGLPDSYVDHDSPAQQRRDCGLDATAILAAVRKHYPHVG